MFSEDLLNNPSVKGWSLFEHLACALSHLNFRALSKVQNWPAGPLPD